MDSRNDLCLGDNPAYRIEVITYIRQDMRDYM